MQYFLDATVDNIFESEASDETSEFDVVETPEINSSFHTFPSGFRFPYNWRRSK